MNFFANDTDREVYYKLSLNWKQYIKTMALKEASMLKETVSLVDAMANSELTESTVKFTSIGFVDLHNLQNAINNSDDTILISRDSLNDTLVNVSDACVAIHNDIEACQTMVVGLDTLSETLESDFSDFSDLYDANLNATIDNVSTTGKYYSSKIKNIIHNTDLSLSDKLTWFKEYLHIGNADTEPSSFADLFDYEDQTYGSPAAAFWYSFDWAENPIGAIRDFWLRGVQWAWNMFAGLFNKILGLGESFGNWFRRTFISGSKISLNKKGEVWGSDAGSFKFTFTVEDDAGAEGQWISDMQSTLYTLVHTDKALRFYVPGGELYVVDVEEDDTGEYTRYEFTCAFRPTYLRPVLLNPYDHSQYYVNRNSSIPDTTEYSTSVQTSLGALVSNLDVLGDPEWYNKDPDSNLNLDDVDSMLDFIQQFKESVFLFGKFCASYAAQPTSFSTKTWVGLTNANMYQNWFKGNWKGFSTTMTDVSTPDSAFNADLGNQCYNDPMPNFVLNLLKFVEQHGETDYDITYEWCIRMTAGLFHVNSSVELANQFLSGLSTVGKVVAGLGLVIAGAICFTKVNRAYQRSTLALDQYAFDAAVLTDSGFATYKQMLKKNTMLGLIRDGIIGGFTKAGSFVASGVAKIGQAAASAVQSKLPTGNSKIAGANTVYEVMGDDGYSITDVAKLITG